MRIVVGTPVAARDWALKGWFECLRAQTRPPDEFVFVVKDLPGYRTRELLHELGPKPPMLSYAIDQTPFTARMDRNKAGVRYVYGDFAWRRNRLLSMALKRDGDVFVSIDTDIMLEDSTILEQLVGMLRTVPVAAPLTFMHPLGWSSECFNAGYLQGGEPGPERAWRRAALSEACGARLIDIPMGVVAMRREVIEKCRYAWHQSGEDIGFAQDLERHGFQCLWDADLEARHVMSEGAL